MRSLSVQAKPQPVLRGVQPWQRSGAAAAAVRAWARWGATFSTAASLRFARMAHGLAAAGCDWAPAAAERLATADGAGLAPLPDAPIMPVRNAQGMSHIIQLVELPDVQTYRFNDCALPLQQARMVHQHAER